MTDDGFLLSKSKIAIIGLGLMGGSLALALRGKCAALYGIDPDLKTRELALRQDIVDLAEADASNLLPLADLVILAAPVIEILTLLDDLPRLAPNPCVVIDLGSTKKAIVAKMEKLPDRFDPIGGHPICGKERLSLENADRTLYFSAPFLLTPLPRTTDRARSAADQIIAAIGAQGKILDAADHDRILASTSHLPFLLSTALVLATPPNVAAFIGPGFRSASRLAGTPSSMMLGVVLSNRENILSALEKLQDELALLTSAISDNDVEALRASLVVSENEYLKFSG
jgi:prephenate dehydrogenase